jgi:hypothetical protein
MLLADLRVSRRKKLERQIQLARSTLRDQRGDVARVVSQWNRIAKRVNVALAKYGRVVDELGLFVPDKIRAVELLDCLKSCVDETQVSPLEEIEGLLLEQETELRAAARASARRKKKKTSARARRR